MGEEIPDSNAESMLLQNCCVIVWKKKLQSKCNVKWIKIAVK